MIILKSSSRAKSFYLLLLVAAISSCGSKSNESETTNSGFDKSTKDAESIDKTQPKEKEDNGSEGKRYKRYGIESGFIEMETSGTYMKGKEVIYFKDWGMKEAKETKSTVEIGGTKNETTSITIIDGEWTYGYDPKTKKGTKMKMGLLDKITKNADSDDLGEIGEDMMKNMGGVKTSTGEVLGRICDIWEVKSMGTKTWVYKYITLKTVVDYSGMKMASTVVKFEENPSIPNEKFIVPSDVTLMEMKYNIGQKKSKKNGN